jgi:malate dehydrogenase
VPIVAEVMKKHGVYDAKKLYGVTTLDVVRSSTFVSGLTASDPATVRVQVVGGHSGVTIVPLLSQTKAGASIVSEGGQKYADLVKRIQFGGDEVVKAKDGAGSATLSMAYGALDT